MAKIKQKSHRGASKRFRLTGEGKAKRKRQGKQHLFAGKSRKALLKKRSTTLVHKADLPSVLAMINV